LERDGKALMRKQLAGQSALEAIEEKLADKKAELAEKKGELEQLNVQIKAKAKAHDITVKAEEVRNDNPC
jgi:hypothetical protein